MTAARDRDRSQAYRTAMSAGLRQILAGKPTAAVDYAEQQVVLALYSAELPDAYLYGLIEASGAIDALTARLQAKSKGPSQRSVSDRGPALPGAGRARDSSRPPWPFASALRRRA